MKFMKKSFVVAACLSTLLVGCGDDNAVSMNTASGIQGQWWYNVKGDEEESSEIYTCFNSNGVAYQISKSILTMGDDVELDVRWYKGTHVAKGDSLTIDFPEKIVFNKMNDTTTADIKLIEGTFKSIGENDTYTYTVYNVLNGDKLTVTMSYGDAILSNELSKATTLPSFMNGIDCK